MKILHVHLSGAEPAERLARWASAGHDVRGAATQLEALKSLQRRPADRAVIDGAGRAREALELIARIRQWERGAELPVRVPTLLLLDPADPLAARAGEAGANDALPPGDESALDAWLAGAPTPLAERHHSGGAADVLDRQILHDISGGDPTDLKKMMDLFFATGREQMDGIEAALRDARQAEVGRLAHKCCGAAMTCGLPALAAALTHLEQLAREPGWTDEHWLTAAQLHSIARVEFERAQAAIGELLAGRAPTA